VWHVLRTKGHLDEESLQAIQQTYVGQMKSVVNAEQLSALRKRYAVRRKV
jgi:hypothetical protein